MARAMRDRAGDRDSQVIVGENHTIPSAEVLWRRHSTRCEGSGQHLDDPVTKYHLTNHELPITATGARVSSTLTPGADVR